MDQSTAHSLAERGKLEYAEGNFLEAADLFLQSAQNYDSIQDQLNAAEMKNNQSVALLQAGNAKGALQATEGTEAIFEQAGDLKRQGIAISNRGAAFEGLKRWGEALQEYDRAAAIFESLGEGDMHSTVRNAAAAIHLRRGRLGDSQMDVLDGLRLVEKPSFSQRMLKFFMKIGLIR